MNPIKIVTILGAKPQDNLSLGSLSHGAMTGRMYRKNRGDFKPRKTTFVGANQEKIIQHFSKIADNSSMEFCKTLYGNGRAAEIIMQTIKESL